MKEITVTRKEFFKMWIDDLRTTKSKQAQGSLHPYKGGYCCLGRASEKARKVGLVHKKTQDYPGADWSYDHNSGTLPEDLASFLGITEHGDFKKRFHKLLGGSSLVELNDNKGKTFKEIADVIELAFQLDAFIKPRKGQKST
jgi:hypothetical protein